MTELSGVYCIRNKLDGKRYVGSAKTLWKRIRSHKYYLNRNEHHNHHLQNAWNKYGSASFVFSILEHCDVKDCITREQVWIDKYKVYDRKLGYNKSPTAGSPLGVIHTEETRAKVSIALKGKKKTEDHAKAIREGKQNISQETKNKMSVYSKNRSQTHLQRLSEAMKGNTRGAGAVVSDEKRKKLSEKAKQRWAEWKRSGKAKEIGDRIRAGHLKARANHV